MLNDSKALYPLSICGTASCTNQMRQHMKNIQVIDGACNATFDIFAASEEEFNLIFLEGQDVAFVDEVIARGPTLALEHAFARIWSRRIQKVNAMGLHGILFYGLAHKKQYYPTRNDEQAINPDGSRLR